MKRKRAIELCCDHAGVSDPMDALEDMLADRIHNPCVCVKCEEVFDVEPDAQIMPCPECDGKAYPLTVLMGVPI